LLITPQSEKLANGHAKNVRPSTETYISSAMCVCTLHGNGTSWRYGCQSTRTRPLLKDPLVPVTTRSRQSGRAADAHTSTSQPVTNAGLVRRPDRLRADERRPTASNQHRTTDYASSPLMWQVQIRKGPQVLES